jgi:DNA-binding LacI/PurR family transcriptional regulator
MGSISEVASLAGVSVATVSRVLNGRHTSLVTEATAHRVRQAATQLDYHPSAAAQALVTGRSKTVALCCHPGFDSNMASMVRLVHHAVRNAGYHLLLVDTKDMDEIRKLLSEQRVDAAIWTRYPVHEADMLAEFRGAPHQVIAAVGEVADRLPLKVCTAFWEDRQGLRMVMEHLEALGHQHVAFSGGTLVSSPSKQLAFEHACNELGLRGQIIYTNDEADQFGAGMEMALQAISQDEVPTAIVGRNDNFALGALRALQNAGLCVPGDISVIGYHDHGEAAYSIPSLTTVRTPELSALDIALKTIFATLDEQHSEDPELSFHQLDLELVVRASTGPPSRGHIKETR